MSIEEFIGLSAEEFAKMTDAQILEYLKPYIATCRPVDGKTFESKKTISVKQEKKKTEDFISMILKKNPEIAKHMK